jgi:hypothetical protein
MRSICGLGGIVRGGAALGGLALAAVTACASPGPGTPDDTFTGNSRSNGGALSGLFVDGQEAKPVAVGSSIG